MTKEADVENFVNVIDEWSREQQDKQQRIASAREKSLNYSQGKKSSVKKIEKKNVKSFVCGNVGKIQPLCKDTSVKEILRL